MKRLLLIPTLLVPIVMVVPFSSCSQYNNNLICTTPDVEINYEGICSFKFNLKSSLSKNQTLVVETRVLDSSKDVIISSVENPIVEDKSVIINLQATGFCQQNDYAKIELLFAILDNEQIIYEQTFDNLRILYTEPTGPIINELWNIQEIDGKQTLIGFKNSSITGQELSPDEIKAILVENQTDHLIIPKTVQVIADDAFNNSEDGDISKLPDNYIKLVAFEKSGQCSTIGKNFLKCFKGAKGCFVSFPKNLCQLDMGCLNGSNINTNIVIPSSLTQIPMFFMTSCFDFNAKISIPDSITNIGNGFLSSCETYNQPIILPLNLETIGTGFLDWCSCFDQPIVIPTNIKTIEPNFLYSCAAFNSTVTLPECLEEIGGNFLAKCKTFNQPLEIPSNILKIDESFLSMDVAFNQPLIFPETITRVGMSCLYGCNNLISPITINAPITSFPEKDFEDAKSFAANKIDAKFFTQGIEIKGQTSLAIKSAFKYTCDEEKNIYRNLK